MENREEPVSSHEAGLNLEEPTRRSVHQAPCGHTWWSWSFSFSKPRRHRDRPASRRHCSSDERMSGLGITVNQQGGGTGTCRPGQGREWQACAFAARCPVLSPCCEGRLRTLPHPRPRVPCLFCRHNKHPCWTTLLARPREKKGALARRCWNLDLRDASQPPQDCWMVESSPGDEGREPRPSARPPSSRAELRR